ncbi:MAG: tetratricopeptide repeat protein [Alphaproteobacteria bacterium]|nr:tetratricopeptide repeat protein [Alphaproteobacteria bacterium]
MSKNKTEKKLSLKEQYIESQKNAFFREVQEDVQAEQLSKIWQKYKNYIISIIVLILAITIAKNWFITYKKDISLKNAKRFEQIMSKENVSVDTRISELKEFANEAKFGYKNIAYFNIYSTQIENNKYNDAIDTLNDIIKNSSDEVFENLAIIKLGTMLSSLSGKDLTAIKKNLLYINSSKPLSAVAKFVLGSIYVKENNFDSAEKIFEDLVDNINLPVSLKSQSLTLLNYIKSAKTK